MGISLWPTRIQFWSHMIDNGDIWSELGRTWHLFMARFFTLLLIPIATYSLQAIDKYSGKADHKGDVFNLGDLLADAGDDRLKNALKEFRDNQAKLAKAAVKSVCFLSFWIC